MQNAKPDGGTHDRAAVFAQMRADHQRVLGDLDRLTSTAETIAVADAPAASAVRALQAALRKLETQFDTHMRAEDEVVYPAVERALPATRGSLAPLRREHNELREMLTLVLATLERVADAARREQLAIQIQDLVELLRIHIRKEEAIVLSVAEPLLRPSELSSLAARLLIASDHTTGPPGPSSKGLPS
jgi:hemerythrin-like domain-containing protein